MVVYESVFDYVTSCTTLQARIAAIDGVIDQMNLTLLKAATTGEKMEYTLDNGQTKINVVYRNPAELAKSITALETLKQNWTNQLYGRTFRLVDGKSVNNRSNGYF